MIKAAFLLLIACLEAAVGYGQKFIWPDSSAPPTLRADVISIEDLNRQEDVYNELLRYHDPLLYLSPFPHFSPLKQRNSKLQNGEGEKGYWLEGQLSHRFVLYRGKYYSNSLLQRLRVTFDIGFLVRMTKDSSSPLLPGNNDVGFGADFLLSCMKNIETLRKPKIWMKTQLHHYSNGQSGDFYFDPVTRRNNYRNGDFSTNYFQLLLQSATKLSTGHLFSFGLGYQHDLALGGPLVMNKELKESYGQNRLVANVQYVQPPVYKLVSKNRHTSNFTRRSQWGNRSEFIYVIDRNLEKYRHQNKYRLGWHNYLYYMPWLTNEVGLQLHTYVGRDYLNIRFDDVIFTAQAGLIVKIHYRSPFSNNR